MNLPKFSKDQIKKLALSTMGFVFLLYVYFSFFLGPLQKIRAATLAQIADRQERSPARRRHLHQGPLRGI